MPEYQGPDSMAAEFADLRRRLHALETAPQSNVATLENGNFTIRTSTDPNVLASISVDDANNDAAFRVYDASGTVVIYSGTINDGDDGYLAVENGDRSESVLEVRSDLGMVRPVIPVVWQMSYATLKDSIGHPYTDLNGTYEELWNGWVNCSTHLFYEFGVNLQGGVTEAAFKITAQDYFGIYGALGEKTIHEQTGITVDTTISRNDPIPTTTVAGGVVAGKFLLLRVYAKVALDAGSPVLSVAPWIPAIPTQG